MNHWGGRPPSYHDSFFKSGLSFIFKKQKNNSVSFPEVFGGPIIQYHSFKERVEVVCKPTNHLVLAKQDVSAKC